MFVDGLRQDDTLSDTLTESPWLIKLDLIVAKREVSEDWGLGERPACRCPVSGRGVSLTEEAGMAFFLLREGAREETSASWASRVLLKSSCSWQMLGVLVGSLEVVVLEGRRRRMFPSILLKGRPLRRLMGPRLD